MPSALEPTAAVDPSGLGPKELRAATDEARYSCLAEAHETDVSAWVSAQEEEGDGSDVAIAFLARGACSRARAPAVTGRRRIGEPPREERTPRRSKTLAGWWNYFSPPLSTFSMPLAPQLL